MMRPGHLPRRTSDMIPRVGGTRFRLFPAFAEDMMMKCDDAAMMKARSLFESLDLPQKPDGVRILDESGAEVFVWNPGGH